MPELPEVETIKRQLSKVKGKTIKDIEVIFGRKINVPAKEFVKSVRGAKIKDIGRRAKLLFFNLSNGLSMVIHLKMTGRILLKPQVANPTPYTFAVFTLSDGRKFFWDDIRKFGYLKLIPTSALSNLWQKEGFGPEPLEPSFTPKKFGECLKKFSGKKIKPLLMEQRCVAGLGNIYAAEVLGFASVHPARSAQSLSDKEIAKLHSGLRKILISAINARGSSADDYVDLYGDAGDYVPKLKVYGREGEKCAYCNGKIKKITMGGRGTYFCPTHQK